MADKKEELERAAREVFAQKGYKNTSISDITRRAGMAVGSFYKHYASKEAIFLDVYVAENEAVRGQVIQQMDWQAEPEQVINQLFRLIFDSIFPNKILIEWNNPAISPILHQHFSSEEMKKSYHFHQFLMTTFSERLEEEGFGPDMIKKVMQVYQLLYYVDCHTTGTDFTDYSQALQTLVQYFVRGLFAAKPRS